MRTIHHSSYPTREQFITRPTLHENNSPLVYLAKRTRHHSSYHPQGQLSSSFVLPYARKIHHSFPSSYHRPTSHHSSCPTQEQFITPLMLPISSPRLHLGHTGTRPTSTGWLVALQLHTHRGIGRSGVNSHVNNAAAVTHRQN